MKRLFVFIILAAFAISCGNGKSGKNSSGSATVKMNGVWKGVLPAADCSGIEYILKLEPQGTYDLTVTYIDGEGDGVDAVFTSEGKVVRVTREDGEYLRLLPSPGNDTVYFKTVSKDRLRLVSHLSNLPDALAPERYEIVKEK
jgi:hypothetical protein